MILADKITRLRKKNGWSQEELAEKMHVSRQAVSKWEGSQAIPDLERILQLSTLFGVTTDYLLKDELEAEEFTNSSPDSELRCVTLAEANTYLQHRRKSSIQIAAATFLCILSPIALFLLSVFSQTPGSWISENAAVLVGLIVLFVLVAAAVALYILCGFQNAPYVFLEKEDFETEYGVKGMVRERQKQYRPQYIAANIAATCLCILSPIPLLIGAFTENEVAAVAALALTLIIAGIGVMFYIIVGVRWASLQKLLKEEEYTAAEKKNSKIREVVDTAYWLAATAIYLGWSFLSEDWHITWIVWPVAGVLSAAVSAICNLFINKEDP